MSLSTKQFAPVKREQSFRREHRPVPWGSGMMMAIAFLSCMDLHAEPTEIADVQRADAVSFAKDVLPILQRNCLACHSAGEAQGELVLESPQSMRKGGDAGPALIPGRGNDSLLLKLAAHQQEPQMPPEGNDVNAQPLTPAELGLLRLWIDQGALGGSGLAMISPKGWQRLPSRVAPVYCLDLSDDGQYLVASRGNQLYLYHVPTGRLITNLSDSAINDNELDRVSSESPATSRIAHHDLIQSVALNRDGDLLVSGSFREVKLWRRPSDVQLLTVAAAAPLTTVAVSPDRQWIATADASHTIQMWDAKTGQPGTKISGHTDRISSLRFTADGRLVSSSADQSIRFWNAIDGSLTGGIETPGPVHAVEIIATAQDEQQKPRSQMAVSGGADKLLRTWTIPTAAPKSWQLVPGKLSDAVFSHDQRLVAFAMDDGKVQVMRRGDDGDFIPYADWQLTAPASSMAFVNDVTAVGDGTTSIPQLVTTDENGSISLWSLPSHQLVARWRCGLVGVTAVAASHDGKQLATGGDNGAISLWDLSTELIEPLTENAGETSSVYARSPSGSLLATAGTVDRKPAIFVHNLDTGKLEFTLLGHESIIRSLAFSVDNKHIVSGGDDKTVRLWDLGNTGQPEQHKLDGFTASVTAVAFNQSGDQILSGTDDHSVQLWNLGDNMPPKDFEGHDAAILGVGFFDDQPFSVSVDGSVRFWNSAVGNLSRVFNDQVAIRAWSLSPDRKLLALSGDDKNVRLYQVSDGKLQQTLAGHSAEVVSIDFAADAKRLVTTALIADQPSESFVWDLEANPPRLQEIVERRDVNAAMFSQQEGQLLSTDSRGGLQPVRFRLTRFLDGHQHPIRSLAFHSNGQTLFSAAEDGSVRGHSTGSGQQIFSTSHGAAINSLALSPNEQVLATAGENGVIRLWQSNGNAYSISQLTGFSGPVRCVEFSADGTQVLAAAAGDIPIITLMDLKDGAARQHFTSHQQSVIAMAIAADPIEVLGGNAIVSISSDRVWQWTTHAGKTLSGHTGDVTSLAAIPGTPQEIISGSTDRTIRRWNLDSGRMTRQFNHGGPVLAVAVRPDGQRIASASENHTAKLWNPNGQQIAEMRGDVRLQSQVARWKQQQTAAAARLSFAKRRLDAAEKDIPKKVEAEKKIGEVLAAANKDVTDKQAVLDKARAEKIAIEKEAIDAAAAARVAIQSKSTAVDAHKLAVAAVPIAQQRAAQLAAAVNAAPTNEVLQKAAEECKQAVIIAQQHALQMQDAMKAPMKAAADAAAKANEVAEKVSAVQKPYNDALAALKKATTAQNLAAQQHVLAIAELKAAQELTPLAKRAVTVAEADIVEVKSHFEIATKVSKDAELAIRSLAFSPDGSVLVSGGDFHNVHTWDAGSGTPLAAYVGHTESLAAVAFLGNDQLVSTSADHSLRVWQRNPDWRLERTIGSADQPGLISHRAMTLDFNADASQLLVGGGVPSRNGELHIFNVADGQRTLFLPQAHDDVVHSARFSPDGKRIASAGADKYLRTFDTASSQMLRRFEGHTNYVLSVAWKGDGQTLVSSSADNTIKIWDAETADRRRTIDNFEKHLTQVAFIGESDEIVSSCGDRTVRMHRTSNGGVIRNLGGSDGWLHCVDITDDRSVLVAGSDNGTVFVWNGLNGQLLKTLTIGQ